LADQVDVDARLAVPLTAPVLGYWPAMPRRPRGSRSRGRSKDAKLELLANVPLLAGCTKRDLRRIASLADEIDVPEGKVLTRQGEPGRECFVIVDGKAKVAMRGRRSSSMGPGAFVGEISLLDGGPRSATVTAETDMQLLVLTSSGFATLLRDVPMVAPRIMRGLAERLREAEQPRREH
jgi:CRP/FNR family transcriptional regulator, cyclic AMP receptor protein